MTYQPFQFVTVVYRSNGDGDLSIVDEPANYEMTFESLDPFIQRIFIDNRIGIQSGAEVDSSLLLCEARHMGVSISIPSVAWTVNGRAILK